MDIPLKAFSLIIEPGIIEIVPSVKARASTNSSEVSKSVVATFWNPVAPSRFIHSTKTRSEVVFLFKPIVVMGVEVNSNSGFSSTIAGSAQSVISPL